MNKQPNVHERAVKALEEHGHLFQRRCLAQIEYHCSKDFSLRGEEYQVSIAGEDTVIDFILVSKKVVGFNLVFECKRANPDYVTWLFPTSSDIIGRGALRFLITKLNERGGFETAELDLLSVDPKYLVTTGLEVSSTTTGKKKTSRTDTIWSACQQALTGVGGLALEQKEGMQRTKQFSRQYYLPVVVTSARLYVTKYRVWEIDLNTGNLSDLSKASTFSVDWVIYDFPLRGPLQITRPAYSAFGGYGPSEEYRRKFKIKSVAIVNSDSVTRFLTHLDHPVI